MQERSAKSRIRTMHDYFVCSHDVLRNILNDGVIKNRRGKSVSKVDIFRIS